MQTFYYFNISFLFPPAIPAEIQSSPLFFFFFLSNPAPPEIHPLPLHDALPILTASIIGDPTKPYDGNDAATLTPSNFSLAGLIGSEGFTVTQTAGTYNSAHVAAANTVTASLTSDRKSTRLNSSHDQYTHAAFSF